jgi:hypothetical protein
MGYLKKVHCEDVTHEKSRRKACPHGLSSFQCTLRILPKESLNAYYCVCCNEKSYSAKNYALQIG